MKKKLVLNAQNELEQDENEDDSKKLKDPIKEYGQVEITQKGKKNPKGNIHCLTIIGQIEGHMLLPDNNKTTKYEHLIPLLTNIEINDDIDGVLIILNTVGGDVEAGLAISEMISSLSKPTVSLVLGGGHSIGVPLAVSSNYSFIAPSATMTIHPVRMSGLVIGVAQTFDYFQKMQDRIVKFVIDNSNIDEDRFKQLMLDTGKLAKDVGTIIIGDEAVQEGLINEVGGLNNSIEKLYDLIAQKRLQKLNIENNKE